jgi:hypothetical protein
MQFFAALYFLMLLNFKVIFGDNIIAKAVPLAMLFLGIARFAMLEKGKIHVGRVLEKRMYYFIVSFLVVAVISMARTHLPTSTTIGVINSALRTSLLCFFIYSALSHEFRKGDGLTETIGRVTMPILIVPSLLLLACLLSLLLGMTFPGAAPSVPALEEPVLLGYLGYTGSKTGFPLAGGGHANNVGIYAGSIFAMNVGAYLYLNLKSRNKMIVLINIFICFAALLFADSRATFLNSLITVGAVYFLYKTRKLNVLKLVVVIVPLLPFLMLTGLSMLAEVEAVKDFSRGENDFATGNSRKMIWQVCMDEFSDPDVIHFFGYGEYGAYGSGASKLWEHHFGIAVKEGFEYTVSVTHNAFFQSLFDTGFFGSFIFLSVLYVAMSVALDMNKHGIPEVIVFINFILYYILSGVTESAFGNYNETYFALLLTMLISLFVFKNEYLKERERQFHTISRQHT